MLTEEELKIYWDKYYVRLIRFAMTFVVKHDVAQDIVVEVFLKIWKTEINKPAIQFYLFKITRNACIDYFRTNHYNYVEYKDWMEEIEDDVIQYSLLEAFVIAQAYEMVETLPVNQSKILSLFLKGYNTSKIGEKLNISHQTVLNVKGKIISKLRTIMNKQKLLNP